MHPDEKQPKEERCSQAAVEEHVEEMVRLVDALAVESGMELEIVDADIAFLAMGRSRLFVLQASRANPCPVDRVQCFEVPCFEEEVDLVDYAETLIP